MSKTCFNSNCKEASDKWRRGWRCRTGEYADLCDGCASAYEEGKFCEMFHLNASGWRCCESCGKRIHCGCIASFHMFILLDAGGIECLSCAKNNILTPNPAWPPPPHFLSSEPERMKDISTRNWSAITGSGPIPWRQAPSLFNCSSFQLESQPRMAFEVDMSDGIDRFRICERLSSSFLEKKEENSFGRLIYGKLTSGPFESVEDRIAGLSKEEQPNPSVNVSHLRSFPKNDSHTSKLSLAASPPFRNEVNDFDQASATVLQSPSLPTLVGKQVCIHNGMDSSGEAQVRNGKCRGDVRGRNQLLPRYWPRITDKELQQISGTSSSVITPLFEKMLSASDAGRIGRLVLPKKCAEAYFPPISQPEGLPLKVHDLKGKEWSFQFRFWPNNNSRMYVLEGITPCIQSMELQAGDVVTFSRLEPEGKLVMGGRKASTAPPDQGDKATLAGDKIPGDDSGKNKSGEVVTNGHVKGVTKKEILENKFVVRSKRKNSIFGLKSKRLRIDNEEMIELKLTCNQAQGIMRPPPENVPSVFAVEGCEIEEFENAPIIGRPTIPAIDRFGEKIQWVECEDCFKWRKVPANALLPSRWTCSENIWGLDRSLCSTAQQLSTQQLEDILSTTADVVAQEGLDALANLAIQAEGVDLPASSQTKMKHAGHKLNCTCVVCIQPSDGNNPKHKQICDFADSESLKHRFSSLMESSEKKQLAKEAESACQKLQVDNDTYLNNDIGKSSLHQDEERQVACLDDPDERKSSVSPLKGQIDLNIQPEREDDLSPGSDLGAMKCLLVDAAEQYRSSSGVSRDLLDKQMQPDGIGGASFSNCILP
ncbi:B3 domain-containing protein Os07g0563300-like isoform X2 [Olea europaea var. sylvestris]|uniref:B3 domain-containing protein Os07g0563300-like isoform X2 n=1 Tax=Olea europaea var. sylvestris TaxID=158386 RepID=UPI000C1D541A|nr:B3 domain-containing protein Os07g0563300-like isoform X2 [Olea europaea var. sylvestris]